MPWKASCVEEQRVRFVAAWEQEHWSFAGLCREFGISRKTGYKFLRRSQAKDSDWFTDRPRTPRSRPHALSDDMARRLVQARSARPTWGPRKLRAWLVNNDPHTRWPAPSTIGALLKSEGLTVRRRRRQYAPPCQRPLAACQGPNAVWTADLKGWFHTQDGQRCHAFTLCDAYSRFLLRCQALKCADCSTVRPLFDAAFRQFGLPVVIRTDNGPPFASTGLGGLTELSIWWVKLGILPERIDPGHPEQNGRHERLHRTLEEAINPARANRKQQQKAFDDFRKQYNEERPHEALGQCTPASLYTPSDRPYRPRATAVEYPQQMLVRRVRHSGEIKWRNRAVYVSQALAGELVGLSQVDDRYWNVHFGPVSLGLLDTVKGHILRPKRHRKPKPQ